MILVIGGRSKIGSALIAELVLKGEAVRVLARSGESVSSLPNGVKTVIGDLADRDSLRAAITGVEPDVSLVRSG
jgi:NADH dehydrogenase